MSRCLDPCVHYSIIYHSQDIEATEVSVNGLMDKANVVCIGNEIVFGH